jgi:transaldolase
VVESVLSLFVSRWDVAVKDEVVPPRRNQLGIAVAMGTYRAWLELLESDRWKRLAAAGAHVQRMLWASTGTKDPQASPTLYVEALAAPGTIDTVPDKTLEALASTGRIGARMPADGGIADVVLEEFLRAGLDLDKLAERLQREGAEAFEKSWNALMRGLQEKMARLAGGVRAVEPASH